MLKTPKRHVYKTEHVVWAIKRANRSRIATCRRDEETEKGRTKVTKPWYFTTVWRRSLSTDLNQIWCVCRSYQRYYAYQKWFQNFIGFSRPTSGKTHASLKKANGLYNIAMRYRADLSYCEEFKGNQQPAKLVHSSGYQRHHISKDKWLYAE